MTENSEEYYRQKYLKYKVKYLALQEQSGSGFASAIKAFLSLNGTYLIFHSFTKFDEINEINEFMKDYIPKDNNKKNVTINRTILNKFDEESNKKILEKIFNGSVIVHIYKPVLKKDYYIEIAEFDHYLSKRAKLDFNLTTFMEKYKKILKIIDVHEILKQINNNDVQILTKIQNLCIIELNNYYHEKSQNINRQKISLIEYYKQKYPAIENYITDYDQLFIKNNDNGSLILSSVFIMDNVNREGLAVNFNVRNVELTK